MVILKCGLYICTKTVMKQLIPLYVLVTLAACDPLLMKEDGSDEPILYPTDSAYIAVPPNEPSAPKTLYVTGVEYPWGVNWQRDVGYDIAGSSLFLMRDGEKIVELPVGYDKCVSIEADMHRCIDGRLYTDFSTDDETVVMIDGKEAFRYSGREMIRDMCVNDGDIHTISLPRNGADVWAYRLNGELVNSSDGELIGSLYADGSDIIFSYRIDDTYYMSVNGMVSTITINPSFTEIYDVRRIGGVNNFIATDGVNIYAMENNVQIAVIGLFSPSYEISLRICYDGADRLYVGSIGETAGVWKEGRDHVAIYGSVNGFSQCGADYMCVFKNTSKETYAICRNGETVPWPEGMELMYDGCAGTDGTDYTIGVINRGEENAPALWMNDSVTNYDFNGFFTHVDYW